MFYNSILWFLCHKQGFEKFRGVPVRVSESISRAILNGCFVQIIISVYDSKTFNTKRKEYTLL